MRPYPLQYFRTPGTIWVDETIVNNNNLFEFTSIIVLKGHLALVFNVAPVVKRLSICAVCRPSPIRTTVTASTLCQRECIPPGNEHKRLGYVEPLTKAGLDTAGIGSIIRLGELVDIDKVQTQVVILVPFLEFGYKILIPGPIAGDEGLGAVD